MTLDATIPGRGTNVYCFIHDPKQMILLLNLNSKSTPIFVASTKKPIGSYELFLKPVLQNMIVLKNMFVF